MLDPTGARWVRVLLKGSAFVVFFAGGCVLSFFFVPLAWLWGGPSVERRKRSQRAVSRGFRIFHAYMRWCRLVDYKPDRAPPLPAGPLLLIANHPCLVDVTSLLAAYPEFCVVVKSTYFYNPLILPLLLGCGHIRARDGFGGGLAVMDGIQRRLEDGQSVLVFPEGRRSPPGSLRPFHDGALLPALRADVPVQPVLVDVHPELLKRELPWYYMPRVAAELRFELLPRPTPTSERLGSESRRLTRELRAAYEGRLTELRAGR